MEEALHSSEAAVATEPEGNDVLRRMLVRWAEDGTFCVTSLADGLKVIRRLWPERVDIQPTAWESAADSADFTLPNKAFRLLVRLVTGYWEDMVSGGGDAVARKRFSAKEAAWNEAEGVDLTTRTFGGSHGEAPEDRQWLGDVQRLEVPLRLRQRRGENRYRVVRKALG